MAQYITKEGMQIPTVEELIAEITADLRADIDPLLITDADSLMGNFVAIEASHHREGYEALLTAFDALDRDNAEDAILDGVLALTGTLRDPASYSRFAGTRKLEVDLDAGAQLTAETSMVAVTGSNPLIRFVITADDRFVDGVFTAPSDAVYEVEARAENTGPVVANATTVTTIATGTTGWNSVNNPFDAIVGADVEDDASARSRAERELRSAGSCTFGAIKANLLAYTDEEGNHPITAVEVVNNVKDTYDSIGVPPHSFEVILFDGVGAVVTDEDIAQIIFDNQPAGIQSAGLTDYNLEIDGKFFSVSFTRAAQLAVTITITLKKKASLYAGDLPVKEAMAARALLDIGPSIGGESGIVAFSDMSAAALSVAGVTRVTSVAMNLPSGSPAVHTDLTPPARSIGIVDTSTITVVATDET